MSITKPMLAVDAEDVSKLTYPLLASPKLDGIRCLMVDGKALSRKFKSIPNAFIRSWLERHCAKLPLDGELMVGKNFQESSSGIMSSKGEPDFAYWVFDCVYDAAKPFRERYRDLIDVIASSKNVEFMDRVRLVPHQLCNTSEELQEFYDWCLKQGYEGTMVRSISGPYKNGRSTLREQYLLKLKMWLDDEATITGFEEQMRNDNEAKKDELGHTKRSSHQENMVPMDTLGAFVLDWKGHVLKCGTGDGLTQELRKQIWSNRHNLVGKMIKFKWQPFGTKDVPRFPIFLGFRSPDDMGE